jgi:hypothetical protein
MVKSMNGMIERICGLCSLKFTEVASRTSDVTIHLCCFCEKRYHVANHGYGWRVYKRGEMNYTVGT